MLFFDPCSSNSAVRGKAKKSSIDLLLLNIVGSDDTTVLPIKLSVIVEEVVVTLTLASSSFNISLELKLNMYTLLELDEPTACRRQALCG